MRRWMQCWLLVAASFGLLLFAVGCGEGQPAASTAGESTALEKPALEAPSLKPIEVGATKPAHQLGDRFYLAGQPPEGDLATWKELGVRTVVNLRMPGEANWDEKAAVEALGMKYVAVPFRGPDTLGDGQLTAALAVLADADEQPVLLHCASANRVGAIWYAHRIRHDGLPPEAALVEAKTVGLRTTGFVDVVDAYCERAAE